MHIRIPGIIDLVITRDRETIGRAAQSLLLDRKFEPMGPLINRLLSKRVSRALTVNGRRLPSISSRWDQERAQSQCTLQKRLDRLSECKVADDETLQAIVDAVRSGNSRDIAIAAQQAVGRWFVADYLADKQSWRAARDIHASVSSRNIPYVVYLFVTGRVRAAQTLLAERTRGDRAAVHATAIAVHNLVRGFAEMQAVWRDPQLRRRLSDDAVLGRCLFAPANVLRQARAGGPCSAGDVSPGTLVILSLEAARARAPGQDITFLSETWAHCPGGKAVVALLRAVWFELKADRGDG